MSEILREMNENDSEQVIDIFKNAIFEGKSTFRNECPDYKQWDNSHIKCCRFVVVIEGEVRGWCALSPVSSRNEYRGNCEVSIYIDQKFRNNGIGTALLKKIITESENSKIWSLYAAIFQNNIASIKLFKKCGFREIGYREKVARDIFGNWQNTVLFERRSDII